MIVSPLGELFHRLPLAGLQGKVKTILYDGPCFPCQIDGGNQRYVLVARDETMDKGRIAYIDLAKFVGIFCMVLCHAGMHNTLTGIIYSFHMPLFFFLSGFLFDRKKNRVFLPFVLKKAFAILVPYFIFSLILCFGKEGMSDWWYLLYASRDSLAQAGAFTPLWFLPCFFIASVGYFILSKSTRNSDILYYLALTGITILGFALSYLRNRLPWGFPFSFDVALVGIFLMAAGELSHRLDGDKKPILGLLFLIVGICLSPFNLPDSLTEANPHVEMATSTYGHPLMFMTIAVLMCTAIVALCKKICDGRVGQKAIGFLSFYGANTITVLCFHGIFISLLRVGFKAIGLQDFPMEPIIVTLFCFVLLYPTIVFINSCLPNLIGRQSTGRG